MTSWKSLTPEQQLVIKTKQIDVNRTPEEILQLLTSLAEYDRIGDRRRKQFGISAGLLLVAMFIAFFVLRGDQFSAWAKLILGAGSLTCFIVWRKLKGLDLSNNLRGFALPFLVLLREDMEKDQKGHIKLDLRPPTHPSKRQKQSPKYAAGAYYKIIDTFYLDPWLEGTARLADGCSLRWEIVDHIIERRKSKRNARGKHKTKTKYKKKTEMRVQVGLPSASYQLAPAPGGEGVEVKSGEKRDTVKLEREIKSDSLEPLDPRSFIDLVAEAYRRAVPRTARGQS